MKYLVRHPYHLVTLAILLLALTGCSTTPPAGPPTVAAPGSATQTSEGGQVTVAATWDGVQAGGVFTITLDTHAVDLDGYDLSQLATLRADGVEVPAVSWDAPKGGHHRSGLLRFPSVTTDGRTVMGPKTQTVELTIRDIAGVPARTFRWTN